MGHEGRRRPLPRGHLRAGLVSPAVGRARGQRRVPSLKPSCRSARGACHRGHSALRRRRHARGPRQAQVMPRGEGGRLGLHGPALPPGPAGPRPKSCSATQRATPPGRRRRVCEWGNAPQGAARDRFPAHGHLPSQPQMAALGAASPSAGPPSREEISSSVSVSWSLKWV